MSKVPSPFEEPNIETLILATSKLRRVKILHNHLLKSYIAVAKLGDIQLELVHST